MSLNHSLSKPTILFHWLTGILFLTILGIGFYFDFMPRGAEKMQLLGLHKSLGSILLVIAVIRILWRAKEGPLPRLLKTSRWQQIITTSLHHLLLLFTLLMPITGILMSVGSGYGLTVFGVNIIASGDKMPELASIASTIHRTSVNIIIAIVLLHIAAAIKHQWIDKDGTLSRMLGRKY